MDDNFDTSLVVFKAISNFVEALNECYKKKQKGLALYGRLIEKTTLSHTEAIKKHIAAFNTFCVDNREAIETKDVKKMKNGKVVYSDRVQIDVVPLLEEAERDELRVIWSHLLTISALVDPESDAKNVLKKSKTSDGVAEAFGGENDFIKNFVNEFEEKIEKEDIDTSNPMNMINNIMQSGLFTEMVGGMEKGIKSGELDMGNLMGMVQGMMGNMQEEAGDNPMAGMMQGLMSGMMNNMGQGGLGGGGDLLAQLQQQSASGSSVTVDEVVEEDEGETED